MAPTPQDLPTRFPCWCRAVYSWGGESKHDLGFVEGDLIECLNAGDGSWWTGRLWRDKRMTGYFPSNFVKVLDENFTPTTRATSPMPSRGTTPNPYNPVPQQVKAKPMRKPFQAYAAPDTAALKRQELQKQESLLREKTASPRSHRTQSPRCSNPHPNTQTRVQAHGHARNNSHMSQKSHLSHNSQPSLSHSIQSPNRYSYQNIPRGISPAPPTPQSYQPYRPESRHLTTTPSPGPPPTPPHNDHHNDDGDSPPPPPPPVHRYIHTQSRSNASQQQLDIDHNPSSRATTPQQSSDHPTGFTPSPLRNAMDDVMVSLQGMGTGTPQPRQPSPAPIDPWSPAAFNLDDTPRKGLTRPQTAPIQQIDLYKEEPKSQSFNVRRPSAFSSDPPQLSNYVERMESRLGRHRKESPAPSNYSAQNPHIASDTPPPSIPTKIYQSIEHDPPAQSRPQLRQRKSAYEVGRSLLERTFTTRSSATNSSSGVRSDTTTTSTSTTATDRSLMSGYSAGGFSATSAGSLARKRSQIRAKSALGIRQDAARPDYSERSETALTSISYHSSHASVPERPATQADWQNHTGGGVLGGLAAPKAKKSGLFKRFIDSAKTSAANARGNMGENRSLSQASRRIPDGVTSISGGFDNNVDQVPSRPRTAGGSASGSGGYDWVAVRRDVNRSNSLSQIERTERKERCQMMDCHTMAPIDDFYHLVEGDEGADGQPVSTSANFQTVNLSLVDKNARFFNSFPAQTSAAGVATGFICRPYRNDVQRLRAIFTWVSEKICWEGDFEGEVDTERVIETKRGSSEEVAVLVFQLCSAVGIDCTIVPGYLKPPGHSGEMTSQLQTNHWWNAVVVDNEWRIMDCSLASPTNPRRALYSSTGPQLAESWYFLVRPLEICWTHIPISPVDQHICPIINTDVLLALPCVCPPYFKHNLDMPSYDTSLLRIEDLEIAQLKVTVPADIEVVANLQAREYVHDADGDTFESGQIVTKKPLCQASWSPNGEKTYTIKTLLPADEGQGTLYIYAGKRGLMQSIKDIPHPLALTLPIIHTGDNPPFEFVTRHPTPHAMRHDLYIVQPQTRRLAINNTFVFSIRQHPSSLEPLSPDMARASSPNPFARPASALSNFTGISNASEATSNASGGGGRKPAKLAIQAPGGKILRLMRKEEGRGPVQPGLDRNDGAEGGTWETVIKVGETGTWRGLVLADRSARWCVFGEWECV